MAIAGAGGGSGRRVLRSDVAKPQHSIEVEREAREGELPEVSWIPSSGQNLVVALNGSVRNRLRPRSCTHSLQQLEAYLGARGGAALEKGWSVGFVEAKSGRVDKFFSSPSRQTYRSMPAVARALGLLPDSAEKGGRKRKSKSKRKRKRFRLHSHIAQDCGGSSSGLHSSLVDAIDLTQDNCIVVRDEAIFFSAMNPNGNLEMEIKKGAEKAVLINQQDIIEVPEASLSCPPAEQVSHRCEEVFRKIISANEYGTLLSMVQGISSGAWQKGGVYQSPVAFSNVLDLQVIGMRMATGVYGQKPELFLTDIRQVWSKINSVGNQLINHASFLTGFSEGLYKKQLGDRILPPVSSDPDWYCLACTTPTTPTPTPTDTGCSLDGDVHPLYEAAKKDDTASPVYVDQTFKASEIGGSQPCKLCGNAERRDLVINCDGCSKTFHMACLNLPLHEAPPETWYCPSCLCQKCLIDVDDDMILLCDQCDEGYHTYCLSPPLECIPEGSWYCQSCSSQKKISATKGMPKKHASRKRKTTKLKRVGLNSLICR